MHSTMYVMLLRYARRFHLAVGGISNLGIDGTSIVDEAPVCGRD